MRVRARDRLRVHVATVPVAAPRALRISTLSSSQLIGATATIGNLLEHGARLFNVAKEQI